MITLPLRCCAPYFARMYLPASVLIATSTLFTGHASAQCAPDPIGDGGTVTCGAGVDPDGFTTVSLGVTVEHAAGGTIDGEVLLGVGNDTFSQSGSSTSAQDIFMNDGDDAINLNGGLLTGSVHAGAGADTLTFNGASSTERIHAGLGNDVFNLLSGTMEGGTLGDGDDVLTLDGATVNVGFDGNDGVDTANLLSGSTFGIGLNNGNDFIVLDGATVSLIGGESSGFYPGETGDDDIRLLSGQAGYVMGDEGDDTIVLDGANVSQLLAGDTVDIGFFTPASLGSGADNIQLLSGSAASVSGGAGNDTLLANGATVSGNLEGDDGDDQINLFGGSILSTFAGDGNDVVTLDGATVDGINGDGGNDEIHLLSGSFVDIDMSGDSGTSGGDGEDLMVLDGVVSPAAGMGGGGDADELRLLSGQLAFAGGEGGNDLITLDGASLMAVLGEAGNFGLGLTGDDHIDLLSGTSGFVNGDAGDDTIILDGATISNTIAGDSIDFGFGAPADPGSGNDDIFWFSGTVQTIFGGDGSDELTVSSATYDGTQVLDGGDDLLAADGWSDLLTLQGLNLALVGGNITNWENIVIENSTVSVVDALLAVGSDPGNGLTLANDGALTLQDGVPGTGLTIDGNFNGGGQILLDSTLGNSASSTDTFTVNGDAIGSVTTLNISNVGGAGAATTGDGMLVVAVNGSSSPTAFRLAAGELRAGDFVYELVQVGQNWFLQSLGSSTPASSTIAIPTQTPWFKLLTIACLGLLGGAALWRLRQDSGAAL